MQGSLQNSEMGQESFASLLTAPSVDGKCKHVCYGRVQENTLNKLQGSGWTIMLSKLLVSLETGCD